MIACYAWTDTQIVNMIQVLRTFYSDQSADLYVLKLDRISDSLLTAAEHCVFHQVCRIPPPPDFQPDHFVQCVPGIKTIFIGRQVQASFMPALSDCSHEYTLVLLPGFWAESLHFLRVMFPKHMPQIRFVEEGMYSYLKNCFRCRIDSPWKDCLERYLRHGTFYVRAKKRVDGFFLYRPEDIKVSYSFPCIRIPALNIRSSFWHGFFSKMIPESLRNAYQDRRFIFLVGALKSGYEPTYARTQELINLVADTISPEDLVVRPHPASRQGLCVLSDLILIDRSAYWFEGLGSVVDLRTKTLIARNSSALSAFIRMGIVPRQIILTYKLYDYYQAHGDPYRDELAEQLRLSVQTLVPADERELKEILMSD